MILEEKHLPCVEWLFGYYILFRYFKSFPLIRSVFLVIHMFLNLNSRNWYFWISLEVSSLWNTQTCPFGTNIHTTRIKKIIEITCCLNSDIWCDLALNLYLHDCCITLLPHANNQVWTVLVCYWYVQWDCNSDLFRLLWVIEKYV